MEDDVSLLECKHASNCIQVLEWQINFMLDTTHFQFFSDDFYLKCRDVQRVIKELRSNYINQIKFQSYV